MDKQQKTQGVYSQGMLTKKVFLTMDQVGQNIKQNLERSISHCIEGNVLKMVILNRIQSG